jgi:hypothetical protein
MREKRRDGRGRNRHRDRHRVENHGRDKKEKEYRCKESLGVIPQVADAEQ